MKTGSSRLAPERLGDAIAAYLGTSSATQCPPSAAGIMGEWRPGPWREAERRAEQRGGTALRKQQRELKGHYPVKAIPAAAPDHPRFVTVTRALVDAGASGKDWKGDPVGWTNRQVAILDPVSKRKPIKGWRYRSDGRQIPWRDAVAFLTTAKRKKLRPKPGSAKESAAIDTLMRLVAGQSAQRQPPYSESQAVLPRDAACPLCQGRRVTPEGQPCPMCSDETPPWE